MMDSEFTGETIVTLSHERARAAEPEITRDAPDADRVTTYSVGQSVHRYILLSRLGRGGMGEVWKAFDPELNRALAIKFVLPERVLDTKDKAQVDSQAAAQQLLLEARAMARLAHPHVVPAYDVGLHEQSVYLAMEFIQGADLRSRIREQGGRVSVSLALQWFLPAARGLAAAHAAGIIHRDFKPDNVLLGDDGRVLITDFGLVGTPERSELARLSQSDRRFSSKVQSALQRVTSSDEVAATLDDSDEIAGTPAYMSPEQHMASPLDPRSDQFSFCVSLWEALYGVRPFKGRTRLQIFHNITARRAETGDDRARVPAWIRKIILKGLAVHPKQRYDSMADLIQAIERGQHRWRRRATWVFSGSVASSLALYPALLWGGAQPSQCHVGAAQVESVWNSERSSAIRTQFKDEADAYGVGVWDRAAMVLDRVRENWSQEYVALCEGLEDAATHARQVMYEGKLRCQKARLRQLDASLVTLQSANLAVVNRAEWMVDRLARAESCLAQSEHETGLLAKPSFEQEQYWELAAKVEDAELAFEVGAREKSQKLLTEVAGALDASVPRWVVARIEYSMGRVYAVHHDAKDSTYWLGRALQDALATQQADVASLAASQRVFAEVYLAQRVDDFEELDRFAQAMLERTGEREELVAQWLSSSTPALSAVQQQDEAILRTKRSVEYYLSTLGSRSILTTTALNNLSRLYLIRSRFSDAEPLLQVAMRSELEMYDGKHPHFVTTVVNLAFAQRGLGRLIDAQRTLESLGPIESLRKIVSPGTYLWLYRNQGALRYERGAYAAAAEAWRQSMGPEELVAHQLHRTRASHAQNFVRSLALSGATDEALAVAKTWTPRTAQWFEADHPAHLGSIGAQAVAELQAGHVEDALANFERCIDQTPVYSDADPSSWESVALDYVRALLSVGQVEKALDIGTKAREQAARRFGDTSVHLVRYDLVLSQIFVAQNEIDAAADAIVRALHEGAQELLHEGELWEQVRETAQSLRERSESEHLAHVLGPWTR